MTKISAVDLADPNLYCLSLRRLPVELINNDYTSKNLLMTLTIGRDFGIISPSGSG